MEAVGSGGGVADQACVTGAADVADGEPVPARLRVPAAPRADLEWTPQALSHGGESIGPATAEAVTRLMAENRHPEHGYRACLGLLSLAKRYGKVRLEAACMLALQIGACQYRHVNDILKNNRDQSIPAVADEWVSPEHVHLRGPGYYQ